MKKIRRSSANWSNVFVARHVSGQANKVGAMMVSCMWMECWHILRDDFALFVVNHYGKGTKASEAIASNWCANCGAKHGNNSNGCVVSAQPATLANTLDDCEGKVNVFRCFARASEGTLANEWRRYGANEGEAVLRVSHHRRKNSSKSGSGA